MRSGAIKGVLSSQVAPALARALALGLSGVVHRMQLSLDKLRIDIKGILHDTCDLHVPIGRVVARKRNIQLDCNFQDMPAH